MLYRKFDYLTKFDKLENGVFGKNYKDIAMKRCMLIKSYLGETIICQKRKKSRIYLSEIF